MTSTDTFQRLTREEDAARVEKAEQVEREDRERFEAMRAEEEARVALLDKKKIDERVGYKKRFDRTGEDFRTKEKRKRERGQQNSGGDYVQEEKRRLRHGSTNFDS